MHFERRLHTIAAESGRLEEEVASARGAAYSLRRSIRARERTYEVMGFACARLVNAYVKRSESLSFAAQTVAFGNESPAWLRSYLEDEARPANTTGTQLVRIERTAE